MYIFVYVTASTVGKAILCLIDARTLPSLAQLCPKYSERLSLENNVRAIMSSDGFYHYYSMFFYRVTNTPTACTVVQLENKK